LFTGVKKMLRRLTDNVIWLGRMREWLWWLLGGVAVVAVLAVAVPYVYIHFIEPDPAPKPTLTDISDSGDATTTTVAQSDRASLAGTWNIASGSIAQYRVQEVLNGQDAEATGTTSDVTGSITILGTDVTAGDFTVDLTTLESGNGNRDNQVQGRILDTAQFPTATFKLTKPIALGSEPADGTKITATATGDLTLHGVTKTVTFQVQAQRIGNTIEVTGEVPIHFPDYNVDNPSGGPAQVGDDGTMEFGLKFSPAS
jgi:polyisoprenoid-binding protein YceI